MVEPKILAEALRVPLCWCERCSRQLYRDSTGNCHWEEGNWHGVCWACLRDEED